MLTLEQCRKLDPNLADLSDEELAEMRDLIYRMADLLIETWMEIHGSNTSPVGTCNVESSGGTID